MIIIGMTGPIGHGKSTFAKAVSALEPSTIRFESSLIIAEVANALHASSRFIPERDDIESVNRWLHPLPAILLQITHTYCSFDQLKLDINAIKHHPVEYDKLFLHIENLHRNPVLNEQEITNENKEAYRPILQWLGGYLVRKIGGGIWYEEILRRAKEANRQGYKICIIGGLRYPHDAELVKQGGGVVIKVYRPGHLQYDMLDPTERERENIRPDANIISDGTIEEMAATAKIVISDIKSGKLQSQYRTSAALKT